MPVTEQEAEDMGRVPGGRTAWTLGKVALAHPTLLS